MPEPRSRWAGLARFVVRRAVLIVVGAAVLSVVAAWAGSRLRVSADLWRLLPEDYPSYQALERARRLVGGENPIEVVIEGPFRASRRFADRLVPALEGGRQPDGTAFFPRVEYRRDVAFLARHALYFATDTELDSVVAALETLARDARRQANPLTRRAGNDSTMAGRLRTLRATFDAFIGSEYPVSPDSTVMVIRVHAASSQGDLAFVDAAVDAVNHAIADLDPARQFADLRIGVGGRFLQERMEARSVTRHVRLGGVIALPVVLVLVAVALGPRRAASWAVAVPLLMSITWTYALAWLAFGVLNVVTITLGLVLVGMGVDYGLHMLAAYGAHRREGWDVPSALERTYRGTATAIVVGALTTAAGLYALMVADFRAFREFGFLAGTGILLALVATLVVLPALVVLVDRGGYVVTPVTRRAPGLMTHRWAAACLAIVALVTAWAAGHMRDVRFEYHAGALRPEFPEYQELRRLADRVHPTVGYGNPALLIADTPEVVPGVVVALAARAAGSGSSIGRVEALQDRVPMTPVAQAARMARLRDVRALLDGSVLGDVHTPDLDALRQAAALDAPIPPASIPPSLVGPFATRDGTIGRVVMVYPARSLSDGRNSLAFADEAGRVTLEDGRVYYAASMAIVAADMIRLMQADSRRIVLALLAGLAGAMLVTFRSWRWASLALLPTVVGGVWLAGLMVAMDVRLNLFNLAVLPVILGVGNDVGVHLVHGFRHARVIGLLSARRRVVVATATTAVGFGALTLTGHPGVASMGVLAALGLGATTVAGLCTVTAMLALRSVDA